MSCIKPSASKADLKRPATAPRDWPASLALAVVEVIEESPPQGDKPVHWLLLASRRVESVRDARRLVAWYRRRWSIEQLFRTLKTQGFDIEQSQMIEASHFVKLLAATLIAAVVVMQLIHAHDGNSRQRIEDAAIGLDQRFPAALNAIFEGKTQKQKNPHPSYSPAPLA